MVVGLSYTIAMPVRQMQMSHYNVGVPRTATRWKVTSLACTLEVYEPPPHGKGGQYTEFTLTDVQMICNGNH